MSSYFFHARLTEHDTDDGRPHSADWHANAERMREAALADQAVEQPEDEPPPPPSLPARVEGGYPAPG